MKQVIAQKTLARLLCVAVLSPIWMSGVFAAKTTVAQATPVPFSVPGVVLAETTVASLPPAPLVVALSRLTLAPTAVFADLSVPGPQLIAVESGSLMVTMTGDEDEAEEIEGRVHRGGTPVAQGLATPTAGSFVFTLVPG